MEEQRTSGQTMQTSAQHSDSIQIKKHTLWQGLFAVLFVISLFTGGFGIGDGSTGAAVIPTALGQPSAPSIPTGVALVSAEELVDDDPVLGNEDAPVTIVEFSDYQCPYCSRFRFETLDQIKSAYIDTGKAKFVYRDFPLSSIHPFAQKAAEASECADDQGKFWEYHDALFTNQQLLDSADLGLNSGDFDSCLDSGKYQQEVQKDFQDAQRAGGQGTPYFVIGNTPLSGAQPFQNFQAAIEAELAN